MPATCVLPLTPRPCGAIQKNGWAPYAVSLAEYLTDAAPRLIDPDAPGDNIERICTRVSMGYRPTPHEVAWATHKIVRSVCGLIDNRHRVFWTSRELECVECATGRKAVSLGLGQP